MKVSYASIRNEKTLCESNFREEMFRLKQVVPDVQAFQIPEKFRIPIVQIAHISSERMSEVR